MFPHLLFGVVALAVCAFCLVDGKDYCETTEAVQILQKSCKQDDMLEAESGGNSTEVCRQYPLLMICAVTALPQCYHHIEKTFNMYGHSPFSCTLTSEVIIELQEIVNKGMQVTVLPTSTTPATSTSTVQEEKSGETFLTSTSRDSTQREIVVQGTNDKHQGDTTHDDGNIVTSNISTTVVLLVATSLLRRLTS